MTELKEKIIRQAKQMFWDYGLKRVGIDDICNELHISKKTFYTVFKTKNELIEEILKSVRIEEKQSKEIADNDNIIEYLISKILPRAFRQTLSADERRLRGKYAGHSQYGHCTRVVSTRYGPYAYKKTHKRDILQYVGVLKYEQNTVYTHDGLLYGHYVPHRVQQ